MRKSIALLTAIALTGCGKPEPVVTAIDTFCIRVPEHPPITAEQKAVFKAAPAVWEPLVNWILGVQDQRDEANCAGEPPAPALRFGGPK